MSTKCHWKDCEKMFKKNLKLENATFVSRYWFCKTTGNLVNDTTYGLLL